MKGRNTKIRFKSSSGYTLIEILVVILIFAILMYVVVQSLATTFRGTRKSENEVTVRENLDFTASTIERVLRNAQSLDCLNPRTLEFVDQSNRTSSFSCTPSTTKGKIASESANLTTSDVYIDCTQNVFTCTAETNDVPASVKLYLVGKNATSGGTDVSSVTTETTVMLRYYK